MIIMSFVEMMVGTAQNIINYLLLLLYIVNCSKFIWFFDLIWFGHYNTAAWDGITLALCPSIMCVVVIFDFACRDIRNQSEGSWVRIPLYGIPYTDSKSSDVWFFWFSFKLFHDDIDNKSESQGWFCLFFVFFLTSSQLFVVFLFLNEFGVIYCRCYAECLLWFCGGFFFSKGEFLEPLSPSRWFLILYDTIVTGMSQ